jgi:hypothetical protein
MLRNAVAPHCTHSVQPVAINLANDLVATGGASSVSFGMKLAYQLLTAIRLLFQPHCLPF